MEEQTPEQKATAEAKEEKEAAEKAKSEEEQRLKEEAEAREKAEAAKKKLQVVTFRANVYEDSKRYLAGKKYKISGALAQKLESFIE